MAFGGFSGSLSGLSAIGQGYNAGQEENLKLDKEKQGALAKTALGNALSMLSQQQQMQAPQFNAPLQQPQGGAPPPGGPPGGGMPPSPAGGPPGGIPQPPAPGQPSPPMMRPGMPPQGGPPRVGMPPGGAPQSGPMQMPQMPPGPGGGRSLDWRQLVQAVQQANPNIEPAVLLEAVNQFMPMMTMQSQQEWRQVSLQIREQQIQQREQALLMADKTKREEGAANRESREGIASANRVSKETIAKMSVDERREAHEAGLISKEQMDAANRESREKVAGQKLDQSEKHFQQREDRLERALSLREDSTYQRLEQAKQAAIQRAEAAQGRQGLAEARAAIDAQDKHIRTRIQAYSQNNTMKPAERKAMLDQADMDYNTEIAKLRERFGRSMPAGGATGEPSTSKVPDRISPAGGGSPAKPDAVSIPPEAVSQLKEGQVTTFQNGQKWTLKDGKPAQVP